MRSKNIHQGIAALPPTRRDATFSRRLLATVFCAALACIGAGARAQAPADDAGARQPETRPDDSVRTDAAALDNIVVPYDERDNTQLGSFEEADDAYLALGRRVLRSTGVDAARFTFAAPIARGGWYRVYLRWPARPAGDAAVSARVLHARGATARTVDQSTQGGQWHLLGIFAFEPGNAPRIELSTPSKQSLVADAARFQFVGTQAPPLRITTDALAVAQVGVPYAETLQAEGIDTGLRWRAVSALPEGLALDSSGRIAGTPQRARSMVVTLEVRDRAGRVATRELSLEVVVASAPDAGATDSAAPNVTAPDSRAPDAAAASAARSSVEAASAPSIAPSIAPAIAEATASASLGASADLSGILSILRAAPAGSWVRANLNRYADVWPAAELRPLYNSSNPTPEKIILAWSSFAWDSNRARLWMFGGGHANYSGNDVYTWSASTRMWERAALSSEIVADPLGIWMAIDGVDRAPASAHTYDNNIFLPIVDRFLTFGGGTQDGAGNWRRQATATTARRTGPYLFDPNRADGSKVGGSTGSHVKRVAPHPEIVGGNMWQNRDLPLNFATPSLVPASHANGCTAYATEGGKDVVYLGARPGSGTNLTLYRYVINDVANPRTDGLSVVGAYAVGPSAMTACAYDPVTRLLVRTGSSATVPFTYWNLNTAGPTNRDIVVPLQDPGGVFLPLVRAGTLRPQFCGMDFDATRRKFLLWCGDDRVWSLTSPTGGAGWVIRRETGVAGATGRPTLGPGTGVLGKWEYAANLDAFVGLQDIVAGNVWLYKPVGWVDPAGGTDGAGANVPPSVALTAPTSGAQFAAGASIALAASASDADGQIASVRFFRGSTLIGQDTTAPYSLTWASVPAGSYTLTAVATDNDGTTATSSPVTISVGATSTGATTRTLQDGVSAYVGTRETYMSRIYPGSNYGKATMIQSNATDVSSLVRFAIFQSEGGPVPDGATITAATVELYKYTAYDHVFRLHRLLAPWDETQASWNQRLTGVAWRVPGAGGAGTDYAASADGQASVGWNPQWLTIDVTAAVQAMSNGTPNHGWKLVPVSGNMNLKRFYSREFGTVNLRPKLTITYR